MIEFQTVAHFLILILYCTVYGLGDFVSHYHGLKQGRCEDINMGGGGHHVLTNFS
jgi:hypothetical protein